MCQIMLDAIALMWILGGASLGILGVKAYRRYLSNKNIVKHESDTAPDSVSK